jgi:hypothetical protein
MPEIARDAPDYDWNCQELQFNRAVTKIKNVISKREEKQPRKLFPGVANRLN